MSFQHKKTRNIYSPSILMLVSAVYLDLRNLILVVELAIIQKIQFTYFSYEVK
jgi:hypothetical protein